MKKINVNPFFILLLSASMLTVPISCDKDSDSPAQYQVAGLWTGTYTVNALPAQGALPYSFIVYPDGTLLTRGRAGDGNDYYSKGTWTLSNNTQFSGTVISFVNPPGTLPVTQSITGTFSNTGTLTNASWQDTNNPNGAPNSGNFSTMQRVN